MDIGINNGYPACALSNLTPHSFTIDNVWCASMEGFLQSLKFDKISVQEEVCKLTGLAAKYRGKRRNKAWQNSQILWWKGFMYSREGHAYFWLLEHAYAEMFDQSKSFRLALKATGNATLTHSIGCNDPSETIITSNEFCQILTKLRVPK